MLISGMQYTDSMFYRLNTIQVIMKYLLYSLGYDPVPHYFCPPFGAISYGIYVLWTYLHWSVSKTSLIWG